ncbi:CBS domain-containing protein [Terasakiella sp. SH-1]|uniref:CBS domain-containing protein n=1 Tax=Terasakiella sp. SH-1 TaxID=2560057 RepID=UPI001073927F|nr:CBS domain-containing protein [Terasakiella sp. SH-1]
MQKKLVPDVIKECRCLTILPDKTVHQAAALMTNENIGALVVVKGTRIVGIITERDLMRKVVAVGLEPDATLVKDVMTPNPDTVTGDMLSGQALDMMVEKGYRHLPIVDEDQKPIGMVSVRDLYQAVQAGLAEDLHACEAYVHGEDGYGIGA